MTPTRYSLFAASALALAACSNTPDAEVNNDGSFDTIASSDDGDIQAALFALPEAQVVDVGVHNLPTFIRGNLGQSNQSLAAMGLAGVQSNLAVSVQRVAPAFGLKARDLAIKSTKQDELGFTHVRYNQTKNGLPVVGGELVFHVKPNGVLYAVNGFVRDIANLSAIPSISAEMAVASAQGAMNEVGSKSAGPARLVYFLNGSTGGLDLAYELEVSGQRADGLPVRDRVYVSAATGATLDRHPQIHDIRNREVHNLNHGTSLPGPVARTEGQAANADSVVNANYDQLGTTYDCYQALFGRDSFDGAGGKLISSVHYSNNYVNAYWNGTQMVYGDGDGQQAGNLAIDLDVTAHELTHGVTSSEANLTYRNESGALNEAMSDIASAFCQAWKEGNINANTWMIGEAIWTPGTAGDALRYMDNPTKDGQSKDYYPERYTGTSDNGGVHTNSGIANLAFKLLSTGGVHPRNKTTVNVTGIGIDKAAKIYYRALTNIMTASTNFQGARAATAQAASELYGQAEVDAVHQSWDAVGAPGGGTTNPVTALTNGVPKDNLSGAANSDTFYKLDVPANSTNLKFNISGGTGNADLYVRFGSQPSTTTYDCRPMAAGNTEECAFPTPNAGTYYVMVHATAAYSGLSLVGAFTTGGGDTTPVLVNGTPVNNISGAVRSSQYWKIDVPAGASVTFATSGGTGDADLYVRKGDKPTTSLYDCRPYLSSNNESCTLTNATATTYYVMIRGFQTYSGVSLSARH